jgi:hypothetical protein
VTTEADPASPAPAQPAVADNQAIVRALGVLADRIGDLEDAVAEAVEELGKVRKTVSNLKDEVATKKQVKKLKKILDQLEVIEVGDGAPADESDGNVKE